MAPIELTEAITATRRVRIIFYIGLRQGAPEGSPRRENRPPSGYSEGWGGRGARRNVKTNPGMCKGNPPPCSGDRPACDGKCGFGHVVGSVCKGMEAPCKGGRGPCKGNGATCKGNDWFSRLERGIRS